MGCALHGWDDGRRLRAMNDLDLANDLTPTPHATNGDSGGGGIPNGRDDVSTSPQISPASTFPPAVSTFTEMLPADREVGGEVDGPLTWDGAPTRAMVRALRLERRTPNWDQDIAAQILALVGEGSSLTRACGTLGVSRAMVMAWRKLVPEFDEWLVELETGLGAYHRDVASDEADPAMMKAKLALASAYDRRIAKGESEASVVQGINVTVNW